MYNNKEQIILRQYFQSENCAPKLQRANEHQPGKASPKTQMLKTLQDDM